MTFHDRNIGLLEVVAAKLAPLEIPFAFVGGITTGLYLDNAYAGAARATDDVDCVVQVSTNAQMAKLEAGLRKLGLTNDTSPEAPICRWLCGDIKVDVMPVSKRVFGFSNAWYKDGMRHITRTALPSGRAVPLFEVPYFLATKFEAFLDRGQRDPMLSRDLEDIVAVLDGRLDILREINVSASNVREYLAHQCQSLVAGDKIQRDIMRGHLPFGGSDQNRFQRLLERLSQIATGFK